MAVDAASDATESFTAAKQLLERMCDDDFDLRTDRHLRLHQVRDTKSMTVAAAGRTVRTVVVTNVTLLI